MTTWIIISWVVVVILTGINIFVFLKLKQASQQMLKMAFPGAKNMSEALSQMEKMMGGLKGAKGMKGMGGSPFGGASGGKNQNAQLKAAMEMLQQAQRKR